jgi:hypothetical protein
MSSRVAVPAPAGPRGDRMAGVLALMDELTGLAGAGEGLRRRLEELTNLRTGELHTLLAVADGAARPDAVAEVTGQVDEAAVATVAALQQRGLVTGSDGPAAGGAHAGPLRLTETGRVVQRQAEGLHIRILHGIVTALGEDAAGELRSTVQALGSALTADGPADPLLGRPVPPASIG